MEDSAVCTSSNFVGVMFDWVESVEHRYPARRVGTLSMIISLQERSVSQSGFYLIVGLVLDGKVEVCGKKC